MGTACVACSHGVHASMRVVVRAMHRVVCAVTMVLSRMSGVVRRRVSMLPCVCVPFHRTLPGWSAVSDPCEARPCQARVARTLSC